DKYLVERYFKHGSVAVLMVFTAIIGALALPFIWLFRPGVVALDIQSMAVIAVSGILYMGAIYFYLQALQTEEASTVAPFFQAAGIFGLILGYFVLGEKLSLLQIIGVLLIIAGSVLLSLRLGQGTSRVKTRLVILMLTCALAIALSSLIFKFFAVRDEFWITTFWNFAGQVLFGVILMLIAANRRQFKKMMRSNTSAVLSVNGANELINLGGNLGVRYTLLFVPLGIVQAISSTTSFFVLFFGVVISLFFPKLGSEEIGLASLMQKIIATTLVVAGVLLINLY
ncbi:MAG: DMT family transporter, partial [Methanotrichaceae archaeon]|nr:DMT family transporter [Methanotrichaceae archaeon]